MSELIFNRTLLEKHNQTLAILIIVSISINLLLTVIVLCTVNKPALVVYADEGDFAVLKVKNYKMDETILQTFTKMIVSQYLNFTSESLPGQIEGIAPYLSVKSQKDILIAYKQNQLTIEKEGISQQFVISNVSITKKKNPYWVEVSGQRTLYVNGNSQAKPVTYIFEINKIKPVESNPYGLLVNDVVEKKEKAL